MTREFTYDTEAAEPEELKRAYDTDLREAFPPRS